MNRRWENTLGKMGAKSSFLIETCHIQTKKEKGVGVRGSGCTGVMSAHIEAAFGVWKRVVEIFLEGSSRGGHLV